MRAVISTEPPGGNGLTILTTWSGYFCAAAGRTSADSDARIIKIKRRAGIGRFPYRFYGNAKQAPSKAYVIPMRLARASGLTSGLPLDRFPTVEIAFGWPSLAILMVAP